MKDYLDSIRTKYLSKIIVALVDDIEKHSNINDLYTLSSAVKLAHWLYIIGDTETALYFANIVSELDLTQYSNVKGFQDSAACAKSYKCDALVLCSTICEERADAEKSERYWEYFLTVRLETNKWGKPDDGKVARKRWKRNLETGDLFDTCESQYQTAKIKEHIRGMIYYSYNALIVLLFMKRAGGSELYPINKLAKMIDERVQYLKENIDKTDCKDFV